MTARSYLYVPGDSGERLERSTSRGADAVIADLEDAVAAARRPAARTAIAAWLTSDQVEGQRWVRINAGPEGLKDLDAVHSVHLSGVVVPKVRRVDDLEPVAEALALLDRSQGNAGRGVALMVLVETAGALRDVHAIAEHPAVRMLQMGELDLAAELGIQPSNDGSELSYARSHVVMASAAAGLDPPVGAVSPDFKNLEGYRSSCERLRRLGFFARAAIHPAQIPVIHRVFTPSAAEVEAARRTLSRYEAEVSAGSAVLTDTDGSMVDEAVVRASRRTLALARTLTRARC